MKATEILMAEHKVILRLMAALDNAAWGLEGHKAVRALFFLEAAAFSKGFTDGCHHRKEEGVLFPAMVANGMPQQGGPIAVMLSEHEQGRLYARNIRETAQRFDYGQTAVYKELANLAHGYATLLRQHIHKEDNILFPMADKVIPLDQQDQILNDFEKIEHEETGEDAHNKYLALAEKLEIEGLQYQ